MFNDAYINFLDECFLEIVHLPSIELPRVELSSDRLILFRTIFLAFKKRKTLTRIDLAGPTGKTTFRAGHATDLTTDATTTTSRAQYVSSTVDGARLAPMIGIIKYFYAINNLNAISTNSYDVPHSRVACRSVLRKNLICREGVSERATSSAIHPVPSDSRARIVVPVPQRCAVGVLILFFLVPIARKTKET